MAQPVAPAPIQDGAPAMPAVSPQDTAAPAAGPADGFDPAQVREIMRGIGEVVYEWLPGEDRLTWGENVLDVLAFGDRDAIATGRKYARFLDPENVTSRYDAVMSSGQADQGNGVPFQVTYRLLTQGRDSDVGCWVEDTGRWYAGGDGKPARVQGVVRVVDDRHRRERELQKLSFYDPLTGDYNRARLTAMIEESIANIEQHQISCGFLLAAIDNLAMINDAYGFDVADQVIAAISTRIKSRLRTGDTIGRYAGNKFGLVLLDCSEQDLVITANRLLDVVRQSVIDTAAGPVAATISIGGVALPKQARSVGECLARAEEALEQAKHRRLESFVAYAHSERRESIRKRNVEFADEMVSALNDRRFKIAYQPIVDAKTGEPAFYECLLRLAKPDGSIVSAGHFLPVAEQIGLIRLLDHRVFELVFKSLQDHPELSLTFNVSGVTANDSEWLSNFTACVRSQPDIASRLTVEITETAAIQVEEETVSFVNTVRDLGCKVAIDDFGAGYTSFRNLQLLDIDLVKIDGKFVEKLHQNTDNHFFVRTLVELAKNFNIKTVAEWVCDERDVVLLNELGVDYMQGFLFGAADLAVPGRDDAGASQAEPATVKPGADLDEQSA
jgi:diguanylate cyclase (GGDEF)-like protein